jgi:hypothetical protein
MDANPPRRIEIFAPFGEAFELMLKILFRPFDFVKWLVIGFAAWLATFFGGLNFSYGRGWRTADWNWRSQYEGPAISMHHAPPWVVPLIIVGVFVGLLFLVLFLWLNSRGRFIFTDCIVRNRAAIVAPWKEFRREGDRYFVFQLVFSVCSLILFGGLALAFFLGQSAGHEIIPLALFILCMVVLGLVGIVVAVIMQFMVPVMYRQRCDAISAFRQVWDLIVARPGVFVLFGLFCLVIWIAAGMIGCLVACATCCVAAIPYVGTVILLPVVTVLFAFPLCFLRQFGDPYDPWAAVKLPEPPPFPPANEIPPVQQQPATGETLPAASEPLPPPPPEPPAPPIPQPPPPTS